MYPNGYKPAWNKPDGFDTRKTWHVVALKRLYRVEYAPVWRGPWLKWALWKARGHGDLGSRPLVPGPSAGAGRKRVVRSSFPERKNTRRVQSFRIPPVLPFDRGVKFKISDQQITRATHM